MGPIKTILGGLFTPKSTESGAQKGSAQGIDQRIAKNAVALSQSEKAMSAALMVEVELEKKFVDSESKLADSIDTLERKIEAKIRDIESRGAPLSEADRKSLKQITDTLTELKHEMKDNPLDMSDIKSKNYYAFAATKLSGLFDKLGYAVQHFSSDGSELVRFHEDVQKALVEYKNASLSLETDRLKNAAFHPDKSTKTTKNDNQAKKVLKRHLIEEVNKSRSELISSVKTLQNKLRAREEHIQSNHGIITDQDREALSELYGVLENFGYNMEENPIDISNKESRDNYNNELKYYYHNTGLQIDDLLNQISFEVSDSAYPELNLNLPAQNLQKMLAEYLEKIENFTKLPTS